MKINIEINEELASRAETFFHRLHGAGYEVGYQKDLVQAGKFVVHGPAPLLFKINQHLNAVNAYYMASGR